jgi:hypothetical protein
MMHQKRSYSIAPVTTPEELAEKLTQHIWSGCVGFSLSGYLFLNDSTSPDGAQEFAVLKDNRHELPVQVESITFGWCSEEKALDYIKRTIAGEYDSQAWPILPPAMVDAGFHKPCQHCR